MNARIRCLCIASVCGFVFVLHVTIGGVIQAETGYRLLTKSELSMYTGGDWENQRCSSIASESCPSGTPAAPNSCTAESIARCLITSCFSCSAAAGTTYRNSCPTHPEVNCLNHASENRACGHLTQDGCDLQTLPTVSCRCDGPMGGTQFFCPADDCKTGYEEL